jgi:hypothetical protein
MNMGFREANLSRYWVLTGFCLSKGYLAKARTQGAGLIRNKLDPLARHRR